MIFLLVCCLFVLSLPLHCGGYQNAPAFQYRIIYWIFLYSFGILQGGPSIFICLQLLIRFLSDLQAKLFSFANYSLAFLGINEYSLKIILLKICEWPHTPLIQISNILGYRVSLKKGYLRFMVNLRKNSEVSNLKMSEKLLLKF